MQAKLHTSKIHAKKSMCIGICIPSDCYSRVFVWAEYIYTLHKHTHIHTNANMHIEHTSTRQTNPTSTD